jgi:hypothetical protein
MEKSGLVRHQEKALDPAGLTPSLVVYDDTFFFPLSAGEIPANVVFHWKQRSCLIGRQ